MLESLGPLVSLFKLFAEGLAKAVKKISSSHKRALWRKILEIQLSLEAIIDNAQEILSAIETCGRDDYEINQEIVRDIENLVYHQKARIHMLVDQMHDKDSDEIMRLFAPDIRRNILDLIHIKRGIIGHMIYALSHWEYIEISGRELVANLKTTLLSWDHEKFLLEGSSYIDNLDSSTKMKKVVVSDHLQKQREIVNELMECSKKLSSFIKSQMNLEDVI